jgi:hypothetical protein
MSRSRIITLLSSTLILVGLVGPGLAAGAAPTIDRMEIDDDFEDEELTQACDVAVNTTVRGHIILRTFPGENTGVAEVRTINLGFKATADGRTFRFRDVGVDVTRIEPDGTLVLYVVGQVPFEFAGALKIDLETGDAILEPRDRSEWQLQKACSVLTGA